MVSCGMNFSLSCHLVDRIKTRDYLRSEMGWEGVGNLGMQKFFHAIIGKKYFETNLPQKFQKHLCWRAHSHRLNKAVFFNPPPHRVTDSSLMRFCFFCFFLFFFFFACFGFQRAGSTWFWSSWRYKLCLIHISIFIRVVGSLQFRVQDEFFEASSTF